MRVSDPKTREINNIGDLLQAFTQLDATVSESAMITDAMLDELNLRVMFLLQTLRITVVQNGGIVGADGKVSSVTKTGLQVYQEIGRDKMIAEREKAIRAQGLPTEPPAPATPTNGEAKDLEVEISDDANPALGPRRLTH